MLFAAVVFSIRLGIKKTYLCYLYALLRTCISHAALLRVSSLALLLCPALLRLYFIF